MSRPIPPGPPSLVPRLLSSAVPLIAFPSQLIYNHDLSVLQLPGFTLGSSIDLVLGVFNDAEA